MAHVHIIGAGLAGLAAATRLGASGHNVTLYESAQHAGGRCRSFHDKHLNRHIDNGNHLVLSGNTSIAAYVRDIGASDSFMTLNAAAFPFFDLESRRRWTVRPNAGRLPWWIFSPDRRPPNCAAWDFLSALKLKSAAPDATVQDIFDTDAALFRTFWEPLAVGALNTPVELAAAAPLWPVLAETFALGATACIPRIPKDGLSESLVNPALKHIARHGGQVRFGARLRSVSVTETHIDGLNFAQERVDVDPADIVILAVPHWGIPSICPFIDVPKASHAIVNVHFLLSDTPDSPAVAPFVGLINATAHWVFVRKDVVSVTVSAADELAQLENDAIAARIWPDAAAALNVPATPLPPYRVINEKRATFSQSPMELARRPSTRTNVTNLFLAGDWTDTGLPATIEGAVRSGHAAAKAITQPSH